MPTSGGQDRADCADQFDTLPLGLGRQDEAAGPDLEMTFSGLRRPRAFTTCALGGGSGDLHAIVKITVPTQLSDRERELYEQLAESSPRETAA